MTLYRNLAGQEVFFTLVDVVTGEAVIGASVSAWIAKDSGAQNAGAGTVDDLGNGQYRYNFTADDTDGETVGLLLLATGCVPIAFTWTTDVVPVVPVPGAFLVSLEAVKRHLRLPATVGSPNPEDLDLQLKIAQASDAIRAFVHQIDEGSPPVADTWDDITVPPPVQAAVLYQVADLWMHRGDEGLDRSGLCPEAEAILRATGYRDPVFA